MYLLSSRCFQCQAYSADKSKQEYFFLTAVGTSLSLGSQKITAFVLVIGNTEDLGFRI